MPAIRSCSCSRRHRAMAIFKRCNGCHELYQGKYCPTCRPKQQKAYQRNALDKNKNTRLYHTRLWERCRKNAIIRDMGYDIWLLGIGQVYQCLHPFVHHIKERDEAPDLIFDIDNLITVTKESHEEIHRLYLIDKPAALERIKKGKAEFKRLFGQ